MGALSIKNVQKTFGSQRVLEGINIEAQEGEFLILVGPSGCGKSTLLNLIAGLDSISEGEIHIGGKLVNQLSPKDRDIAMVFQSYALYPNMNVRRNILFGLEIRKIPKEEQAAILQRVSEMLQIEPLLDRKPSQLSGGQRQRVAMGRALARDPSIFLFDEPLSNLDAKLRVEMRHEIKQLHKRMGTTIVYVTHDQIEAMTLGDRIAVMKDGIIQQIGDPREIYDSPNNLFVAGFIGSPSMNFIRAPLVSIDGAPAVRLRSGDQTFDIAVGARQSAVQDFVGRDIIFGVRPEQITHRVASQLQQPDTHLITCPVDLLEPTGPDTLVFVHINDQRVVCRIHPDEARKAGDSIELMMDVSKAVYFDPESEVRLR